MKDSDITEIIRKPQSQQMIYRGCGAVEVAEVVEEREDGERSIEKALEDGRECSRGIPKEFLVVNSKENSVEDHSKDEGLEGEVEEEEDEIDMLVIFCSICHVLEKCAWS